jgi:hypothetical protein
VVSIDSRQNGGLAQTRPGLPGEAVLAAGFGEIEAAGGRREGLAFEAAAGGEGVMVVVVDRDERRETRGQLDARLAGDLSRGDTVGQLLGAVLG